MHEDYKFWVEKLQLQAHPEGGFFKETYRSEGLIPNENLPDDFNGDRNYCTAIYFLITENNFSAFHKIASDEMWHFYAGTGLEVAVIQPDGRFESIKLGNSGKNDEVFQACVPANAWFASRCTNAKGWALVGCTVAPGFDFLDFELAKRSELNQLFPQHQEIITSLTRE